MPDPVYTVWVGPQRGVRTATLRYGYTSLVAPVTDVDYDMATRDVDGRQDAAGARRLRPDAVHVDAPVGDRGRRHARADLGRAPPRHAARRHRARAALRLRLVRDLDRPGVPRVAAVAARPRLRVRDRPRPRRRRAGPRAGTRTGGSSTRRNTFTDFIALRRSTSSPRATRRPTGSPRAAGARAVCSWARSRTCGPTSSRAIVAEVPFVDVVTTMLDADAAAHDHRVGGVGRPARARRVRADEGVFAVRQRRAPADYPAHARDRRASTTRACSTGSRRSGSRSSAPTHVGQADLLRTELGAGHGGPSGRYDAWRDEAIVLAFVCDAVGRHRSDDASAAAHGRRVDPRSRVVDAARAPRGTVAVLCHPHPQYGGTMRSIVISALFEALPARGLACLRFNFRGVEGSDGRTTAKAATNPLDVRRRARRGHRRRGRRLPLALVGWSFGADMALSVEDPRIDGWVGIAPPLRFRPATDYRRGAPRRAAEAARARGARRIPRARATCNERSRRGHDTSRRSGRGREPLLRGAHRSGRRPRRVDYLRDLLRARPLDPSGAERRP